MKIDIVTIFPQMFKGPFDESMLKRAQDKSLVEINIHDLRKWTTDRHKTVDGKPYGGGPGMVMMPQPIFDAVEELKGSFRRPGLRKGLALQQKVILLTPQGEQFKQKRARELSKLDNLILIAGHYEGFDERIRDLVDDEVSIGDYVLTGGELPAMVLVDTVVRLIPGVLGKQESLNDESFNQGLLEYPQYTRPEEFKGKKVPEVLLSGNHAEIEKWRKKEALKRTKKRRSDLLSD